MISLKAAQKIIQDCPVHPQIEELPVLESVNRILGEDIESSIYLPPFDKSAMDGYAVSSKDTSKRFFIRETIPAGYVPGSPIKVGECVKIMTGAMLPEGADRVVKKEITREEEGFMTITGVDYNVNVCKKGEDVIPGKVMIRRGRKIRPQHIGVMASLGYRSVKVFKKPRVGIMTTGSEIVQPGRSLKEGQIYNSNSYSIAAQLAEMGAQVMVREITEDSQEAIRKDLAFLLNRVDILVVSGGVSMGDFDLVPGIMEKLGIKILIRKVEIKPGKPLVFGTRDGKIIFGLPGNPVSTFVVSEIFVRPVILRWQGFNGNPLYFKGILKTNYFRKDAQRTAFIPVRIEEEMVKPVEYHGSAHLAALLEANGLLQIPKGTKEIPKGTIVHVRSI